MRSDGYPFSPSDLTWDPRTGNTIRESELQRRLMVPPGPLQRIRPIVDEMTAAFILSKGLDSGSTTIRSVSNEVCDLLERAGTATRAQTDNLSQDVTIRNVKRLLKKYRRGM